MLILSVAQLVEQLTLNQRVAGSNPVGETLDFISSIQNILISIKMFIFVNNLL